MAETPHILIVEDSMTQAFSLEYLLSENGFRASIAGDGRQALEMAKQHHPDLILSDIAMPRMGGLEFCALAKSDPAIRHIPILLLTELSNLDDMLIGLEARADGYVTKPFDEGFLLRKVRSLVERKPVKPEPDDGRDLEFILDGRRHVITASRRHILEMFLSTYEHSLAQKAALEEKRSQLNEVNARLGASLDQLKASEERFRSLVETVPDIVYRLDADGHFTFLNSAVERLGYHRAELVGTHFSDVMIAQDVPAVSWASAVGRGLAGTTPASPPKLFDERRAGQRMTAGLELRLRTRRPRPPGAQESFLDVEVSSSGLYGEEPDGRRTYVGTVGVIRDVTGRREARDVLIGEQILLEKLINTVPLPIFLVGADGMILRANQALYSFFGFETGAVVGWRWHDLLPQETADLLAAGDGEEVIYEATLIANGEDRRATVSKVRFEQPAGDASYLGVIIDITERARTEMELRNAKRLADEATKAKTEFLAAMSHELRTPLNAILGFSEMIALHQDEGQLERDQDYAACIYESGAHLLAIINDILDISAVEAGRLTLHPEPVDVSALAASAERLIQVRAARRNLKLVMDLGGAPTRILTDARRMKQILINLLGNAVKFTPEGGWVKLRVGTSEDGGVVFVVSDSGIGMDADGLVKAMSLFGQVDSRLVRKYEGTGLGLPLSHNLAEALGGRLDIASALGAGTTVVVTLPASCVVK